MNGREVVHLPRYEHKVRRFLHTFRRCGSARNALVCEKPVAGTSRARKGAWRQWNSGRGRGRREAVSIAIMAVIILLECRTGASTARRNFPGCSPRVTAWYSAYITAEVMSTAAFDYGLRAG
ncbi:hypothetical protein E2C01_001616 [Portunus trituberculatus]|uniref:Uncharacterized protein n=1 Tax=Portunus trituberculatus TaxID=210409 RepID=A0A5B7CI87_PORTR|nr:hypothetical protein [Portunus trituberculatus]